MSLSQELQDLQQRIWDGQVPLEITLSATECRTFDQSDPYIVLYPRLSYLSLLLPRLKSFFSSLLIDPDVNPCSGWFSCENVPLKWHHPVGLLYDVYVGHDSTHDDSVTDDDSGLSRDDPPTFDNSAGESLWRLTLHFANWPEDHLVRLDPAGQILHDAFMNSVKEADFLRNGTAKAVMSLSKNDSTLLWEAVKQHNLPLFNSVNQKLLNHSASELRHVPIRWYLPATNAKSRSDLPTSGVVRVVQALCPLHSQTRQPQTIGSAANSILPTLFPSRRSPLVAQPVLHGAVLPMAAKLEDLMRFAAYADGWLHVAIVMWT